ncbi:MAG: alpha/beta hydrolase [Chloroflexi bacterium]|nr:alpha/beta hydrolase [Chloroflexota bacterium]MCI0576877.1 alpha/beta hydrolase [Chloroflexota bacterium]MCI0646469.1 alpha/beta hydrolase [Chloroflexota bacterium]MCI0729910.1 alpha/beta hydrolase [Chloroflexota bacterium]
MITELSRMIIFILILALLLSACRTQAPTPTPVPPTEEAVSPTGTAAPPAATPEPTDTPEPPPTDTPVPTPTEVPPQSVWEEADCQFDIPAGQDVACGYLTVPEDRSQPDSPTIRLHVGIFRTPSDDPAPDPIIYLEGGPGGNALEPVSLIFNRRFARFLENRDFIMVDQRGTGLSEPALDCPEVTKLGYELLDDDIGVEEGLELQLEAIFACHDRLEEEGINLAAYTSAANAADLNDLRQALGYEEWNLFGLSYGTRLAQTIMRDHPEGIRSVILDSVYPVQLDLYTAVPENASRAFQVLFEGCAADPACNAAYPDLENVLFEIVDELNASPVLIEITNPLTQESYDALLNGDSLVGFLFASLYSAEIIPVLPEIIYDAREGNFDTLALIQGSFLLNADFVSMGMQFSVQCGEEIPFSDEEEVAAAAEAHPELENFIDSAPNLGAGIFAVCENWGAQEATAIENEPVLSNINTLILAGEYDPITPPAWGQLVSENLSNSFYLEFPGVGHGVSISGECPLSVVLSFLDDPSTEPDSSCIATMTGPQFVRETSAEIVLVPFESDTFGISGVVPDGWTESAPGVYARGSSALDPVVIIQQAAPDTSPATLLALLSSSLGLEETPEAAGTREANGLVWTLYETTVQGLLLDIALAQDEAGTTLLVLLQSPAEERDALYEAVFLPAIDALTSG